MARDKTLIKGEIATLEAMRKVRLNKPGLAENVAMIDERLTALRAELANG